jgi:hemerythrin-like domain-containing protein
LSFISELPDIDYFSEVKLYDFIEDYLEDIRRTKIDDVFLKVISSFGCSYSTSLINRQLKRMKKEGKIMITRFNKDFNRLSAQYSERKDVVIEYK